MKPFTINKLSIVLLCLGGSLLLSPQSRAQSEIAPDHFDGTDSWAAEASAKARASKAKSNSATASLQARSTKPVSPALQPVAARQVVAPRGSTPATKKREPATANN
jgi:hypothetical protein